MSLVLSGAALVLPDRILTPGTLVVHDGRIVEIRTSTPPSSPAFAFHNHYIVPGLIDVHVHGVEGADTLDEGEPIAAMAASLPRYGVTAFCPTAAACGPSAVDRMLAQVRSLRAAPPAGSARVLPLHLESAFINPAFAGAQPVACLRSPRSAFAGTRSAAETFAAGDLLQAIERGVPDIGIVTLAPEIDGGMELVRWLTERGIRVSLGHSGATYDEALLAIAAGARLATHLFNCMPPLDRRAPGLASAVLQSDDVAAEVICDGVHVHPALVRTVVAAKRPSRVMAITDGTAAAGLPAGARALLAGREITVDRGAARLADGTLAGSVMTMDGVFRLLVEQVGVSLVDAAAMCATTAARELGLVGHGMIAPDAVANLVVLDAQLSVVQTYIDGQLVYAKDRSLAR